MKMVTVSYFQTSPKSYVWLLIGCPLLLVVHGVVSFISWLFVITIPIAKVTFAYFFFLLKLQEEGKRKYTYRDHT